MINNPIIRNYINKLSQALWNGGISNPFTAVEQITYLFFIKMIEQLDDFEQQDSLIHTNSIYDGDYAPYVDESLYVPNDGTFQYEESMLLDKKKAEDRRLRSRNELRWSYFQSMDPDQKLEHIKHNVFPFIKSLSGNYARFSKNISGSNLLISKASLLNQALFIIDQIFEEVERLQPLNHIKITLYGEVYETLLQQLVISGNASQITTPRHIIKLIVALLDPKLEQKIADPACGTGGFLIGAFNHIAKRLVKPNGDISPFSEIDSSYDPFLPGILQKKYVESLNNSFFGTDLDQLMVQISLMNLLIHGIEDPNVEIRDAISGGFANSEQFDIVMTNPPFTGTTDKGNIDHNLTLQTNKIQLLFLERIFHMLKYNGRAAVIVPHGTLFNTSKAALEIRRKIVEEADLNAVIALPNGVFSPGASVKTAILIFTRGRTTTRTLFYDIKNDGFELNNKRLPLFDSGGQRDYGDLNDVLFQFKNREAMIEDNRYSNCFFVDREEIIENNYDLSFSRYQNLEFEEELGNPYDIFKGLEENEMKVLNEIRELKNLFL